MIKKLALNQAEKVKTGFWSLDPNKISKLFFYLLILFLPTQLGKHFWPNWSFVYGLRLDYLSPTLYFTDIFILAIFIFSLPKLFAEIKNIKQKYWLWIAFFVLSLLLALIGAKNFWAGIYGSVKLLEFSFLIYFVACNYKSLNKIILYFLVFASVIFETVLSFLQYLNQGSLGGIFYFFGERAFNAGTPGIANASISGQLFLRPYATFSHPNVLAGFLVLTMIFLLLFSFKIRWLKMLNWFGGILITVALLTTLGRSAILFWLIYALVLFKFWSVEKYKKRKFNSLQIIFFALAVIGVVTFLILQDNLILQRFLTTSLLDESVIQRQELVVQSLNMFWRNPILGVGINNYFNNLSVISLQSNTLLIQPVHNIFLLALAETGLTGFCFMLFIFAKSIIKAFNQKSTRKYLLMALFAIVFLGMFDHYFLTLQQGQLLFSLVLGISLSKS